MKGEKMYNNAKILEKILLKDNSSLVISRPECSDAGAIIDFLNKVGGETDYLTFGLNEFPLSIHEETAIISECLEQDFNLMIIARIGDEIVAQLFLDRSHKPRLQHIGDLGLAVSKKHWGKSIGVHMMLAAVEWAKLKNISKIQLLVRSDNERAVQLYQKLGYKIEGTITRSVKINGTYFDNYSMGLEI